jgi:hypothetical protein
MKITLLLGQRLLNIMFTQKASLENLFQAKPEVRDLGE